jgi:hypothetical protein
MRKSRAFEWQAAAVTRQSGDNTQQQTPIEREPNRHPTATNPSQPYQQELA